MTYFMGIDIGSRTSKGIITKGVELMVYHILPSGANYGLTAEQLRDELLDKAGLVAHDINYTIMTGRTGSIAFGDENVTDIRCCAKGIKRSLPGTRTIVDIESQTSQVIRLGEQGEISNFVVSEKCAGGSGRFLEVVADILRLSIEDVGPLSLKSHKAVTFSTSCAVFGESEAISRVAEGIPVEDIVAGVHKSIAGKISALVSRVGMEEPCAVCGGAALNTGLIKTLSKQLGVSLLVPSLPNYINALGAAIIAAEKASH
jgi:predicted CoA-substrate-specific enzyme activase